MRSENMSQLTLYGHEDEVNEIASPFSKFTVL